VLFDTYTSQEIKMNELTPSETVALARAITDRSPDYRMASSSLTTGSHNVDFTVHVSGSFYRKANYRQRIVAKADPWLLLHAALGKLNETTVESLVQQAITSDPKLVGDLKAEASKAMEKFKGGTWTDCNGSIRASLQAEKV